MASAPPPERATRATDGGGGGGAALGSSEETPALGMPVVAPSAAPASGGREGTLGAPKHCPTCGARYPEDYAVCPRDATPLLRPGGGEDPLLGQVLGDTYEVVKLVGEGGMGRVYEARHVRLGRRFAVKLLHVELARDPESVARFRREASAAAAVASAHVAQVFDVSATRDGRPYLVTELLDGEDYGVLLERVRVLSVERAVGIARQVCAGLGAAHAAGVIHRDLKPENIHLSTDAAGRERAKVLDFGIAKQTSDDAGLTRTGMLLGTPAYMAPEQARGASGIDGRADIYAVGAMLYRSLTGRPAFGGESASATITRVLHEEPERPRTIRKDLPDALELVIQKAMAKDPAERYPTMQALDEALAPFAPAHVALDGPAGLGAVPLAGASERSRQNTLPTGQRSRSSSDGGVGWARSRTLVAGTASRLWLASAIASLGGLLLREGTTRSLTALESALAIVIATAIAIPLFVLWLRPFARGAWRNTAAMAASAGASTRTLAGTLGAYAVVDGTWRAVDLLLEREPGGPHYATMVALGASLVVGGLGLLAERRAKP